MSTASNVSTGKPKIGGGVYIAPVGTQLPTDATTALNATFANLGYVSEDGVTNSNSADNTDIGAWGGDIVLSVSGTKSDSFKFTLIEALNVDVLKTVYGNDNVSGTLATGITVKANNKVIEPKSWAFDMIMHNGALKRVVIPYGTITERGDTVYKDNEPIGYEVTVMAAPDASDNTHYEYIKAATTPEPDPEGT